MKSNELLVAVERRLKAKCITYIKIRPLFLGCLTGIFWFPACQIKTVIEARIEKRNLFHFMKTLNSVLFVMFLCLFDFVIFTLWCLLFERSLNCFIWFSVCKVLLNVNFIEH